MAFSLGSIFVELAVNHGQFLSGFSEAGLASKKFQREFSSTFGEIGDLAAKALAPLGEFGARIGETLSNVGRFGASAAGQLGGLGGAMGAIGSVGAIAVGAVVALDAGAIGLALHAAEAAAKLYELSQRTGVSVEALSGLGFVARQSGVDQEVMTKGLEKLSKAAFAAGTAPAGAVNAFTRLGVTVRDSGGNFRGAQDILIDLADKFAKMPDGVTKTALAMQLFGRGGAALVPILNEGKQGISDMLDTAQKLGVVIDTATAEASHKLEQNFGQLKAAGEGFSNHLLTALLPALLQVSQVMVDFLKAPDVQKDIGYIITGLVALVKFSFAVGDAFFHVFDQIGILLQRTGEYVIGVFNAVGAGLEGIARAGLGDFSGAKSAFQAGLAGLNAPLSSFVNDSKKTWGDYAKFIAAMQAPLPAAKSGGKGTNVDLKPSEKDTTLDRIQERIKALALETAGWIAIGNAGSQSEALIEEALKKGNAEFGKLSADAAKDKTGAASAFVVKNEDLIKAAGAISVYGAAIKALTGDLDKQGIKLQEQSKSAIALAAAYNEGGAAIAAAVVGKQLEGERQKADVLADAYQKLKAQSDLYHSEKAKLGGAAGPVQGLNVSPETLALLKNGVDQAQTSLASLEASTRQLASLNLSTEIAKEGNAFQTLKPYVDAVSAAYSQSGDAVRAAKVELALYKWEQDQLSKGVEVSAKQKRDYAAILTAADEQAYQNSLTQIAAQYSLNALYDEEIVKLSRVREVMQSNGSSTLLLDAKLLNSQQQLVHQWDEAAFAVGSFGEKTRGVFNEIIIMGQNAGKAIAQAFLGAYDSLTGALAKLATGQKADFKQIFTNLAEQVTKAEIQKGIGSITEKLGLKIPGLGAKADGSSANPFHVIIAGGIGAAGLSGGGGSLFGGLLGGGSKGGGGIFDWLGRLFGGSKSSGGFADASNLYSSNFATLAGGGDFSAGSPMIVGEKGPEIIMPKHSGTVIPNGAAFGKSHTTSIVNNFPVFKDYDKFRRSESQIMAHQHRQMSIAYSRS